MDVKNTKSRIELFNNLMKSLKSDDVENHNVVFECLKNLDVDEHIVMILFLIKFNPDCKWPQSLIRKSKVPKDLIIPYNHIAEVIVKKQIEGEQKEFFNKVLETDLLTSLKQYDYTFIKELVIKT